MTTYTHVPTGEQRPRHTEYGARTFGVADAVWRVGTQAQLVSAMKSARNGTGGTIDLTGDITIDEPMRCANNVELVGGYLLAAPEFNGSYMLDVYNVERVRVRNVRMDANQQDINCIWAHESEDIEIVDSEFENGRCGIFASSGASHITMRGGSSHDHHMFHGIAIQHNDCRSVAVLGVAFHRNAEYGVDSHGTEGEVAGCIFEHNGNQSAKHHGDTKFPAAVDYYVHDNVVRSLGGGLGCLRTYVDGRTPSGLYVYRNMFEGAPHLRADAGSTITYCDNICMTQDGQIITPVVEGSGRMVEDVSLRSLPTEVDTPEPEPKPGPVTGVTAEEAELIAEQVAMDVFAREFSKMRVVYDPAATPPGMMNKPGRRDARHWAGDSD